MIVEFDKSFYKSLNKIADKSIFSRILKAIELLEASNSLDEISNIKKLVGFKFYYRYRIGD